VSPGGPPGLRDGPEAMTDDDEDVPLFGTWRRIYVAVILSALVVMGLVTLFSHWNF